MNIPKAYIGGFQQSFRSPRMILILYAVNILTALILALPFMGALKSAFGHSDIVSNLVNDFDFTTFSNLFFYSGEGVGAIFSGIKWLVLAYFIVSTFLTGGIIRTLNKEKFTTSNFFAGSAYNFFRFLGLSFIMIIVQIIFALLIYGLVVFLIKTYFVSVSSEIILYIIFFVGFIIHLLFFLFISMIGDYAKFYLVLEDNFNIFNGFWKGLQYSFKHFLKTYVLYLILLFLPAVIMYLYIYLEKDIKMATGIGILIVFLLQQAFILLRVILRVWILASQLKLYSDDFIKSENVQQLVMMDIEEENKGNTEKVKKQSRAEKKAEKKAKKEAKAKAKKSEELKKKGLVEEKKYEIDFNKTFTTDQPEGEIINEEEILERMKKAVDTEEFEKNIEDENVKEEETIKDENKIEQVINKDNTNKDKEEIKEKETKKKDEDDLIELDL